MARRTPTLAGQREVLYALQIAALVALGIFILERVAEFLSRIQTLVVIVVGAILFAYAVSPAVGRLERLVPRPIAIGIVYVVLVAVFAALTIYVVPTLNDSVMQFAGDLDRSRGRFEAQAAALPVVERLPSALRDAIVHAPDRLVTLLSNFGAQVASRMVVFALSAASLAAIAIVIPVLSIYLLLDAGRLKRALLWLLPAPARLPAARVVRELDGMLGDFVRGQLLVAAIVGVMVTTLLLVLHVPYALLIGVLASYGLFLYLFYSVYNILMLAVVGIVALGLLIALFTRRRVA